MILHSRNGDTKRDKDVCKMRITIICPSSPQFRNFQLTQHLLNNIYIQMFQIYTASCATQTFSHTAYNKIPRE